MAVARTMGRTEFQQPELGLFGAPMALAVPDKPTLRMDEVAKLLGCSCEHVRHLIEEGTLEAIDIKSFGARKPAHRVMQASLLKFMRNRRTT